MKKRVQRTNEQKRILKRLIDKDVTQKEVARHLGVTPQAVNNRIVREATDVIDEAIDEVLKLRDD